MENHDSKTALLAGRMCALDQHRISRYSFIEVLVMGKLLRSGVGPHLAVNWLEVPTVATLFRSGKKQTPSS